MTMTREEKLEKLIRKYATSYYSGISEVDDDYFDSLVDELRKIKPDSEVLTTGWGYEPRKKVDHWFGLHVGSLGKVKSVDEVPLNLRQYVRVSAKLDGLSVVSYYIDGRRIQCITRGNSYVGMDVTNKMKLIDPDGETLVNIDDTPFTGAVRGEVVMPNSVFELKYKSQKEDDRILNARNIASGLMNRDDFSDDEAADLEYVVYKITYCENYEYLDLYDLGCFLIKNYERRFRRVRNCILNEPITENSLLSHFLSYSKEFPCDGLVLTKLNGIKDGLLDYEEVAYKFQAESVEVTVNEVTYEATRTGRMAPRIWFNPVELSGAKVQKCTGFNASFIRDNLIGPGAVIEVCRSNEVIPHIMKVVTPAPVVTIPTECPSCGAPLVWDGDDLVCEFENESQLAYRFITVVSEVDGAGWRTYDNVVKCFNLYTLDELCKFLDATVRGSQEDIERRADQVREQLPDANIGQHQVAKIVEIFSKIKSPISPTTFLVACNIKGISWKVANLIVSDYPEFFEDLRSNSLDESKLFRIQGVGRSVVNSINCFRDRIVKLLDKITLDKEVVKGERIDTKFKVAITGSLSVKRADFDAELQKRGILQSGNFNEIKYLITNNPDSTSSKMKKAKDKGVEIISEFDFTNKYFN